MVPFVRICLPKSDGISDTENLLLLPVLRMSVWFVAVMTTLGNTIVIIWRFMSHKEDKVLSQFIKNLALADFLMGCYLILVAVKDVMYRDRYNKFAHAWMKSWLCQACGVIAMLSCEVSILILCLITMERFHCIKTNLRIVTLKFAGYCLAGAWLLGFLLAIIPVLKYSKEGFYSLNGLCFPLHIDDPFLNGWEYSAFVFFGVNFSAVVLIIVLYSQMFLLIKRDREVARPVILKKHEDAILALRFFLIVLTDCLCWIPIVLVKLASLFGVKISHDLYAFIIVFVLPINSALNPVLYTLAARTELRRRIEKSLERTLVCLQHFKSVVRSEEKASTSTPLTQSLTVTDSRSVSNGSILPLSTLTASSGADSDPCLLYHNRKESDIPTPI